MPIGSAATLPLLLLLGCLHGPHPYAVLGSALSGDGPVAQVSTVTFSSPSNSSPYSVSMVDALTGQSTTVAITTDGSATDTEAGDLFVAAHVLDPVANSFFSAVNVTGTVTLTCRTPNRAITLAEVVDTGGHMAVATTTAAAAATDYPLGRAVQLSTLAANPTQPVASLPDTPTQGTVTLTITHAGSATYTALIGVRGPMGENVTLTIPFAAGGDVTATGAAAVAAVEANTQLYGTALIDGSAAAPVGADVVVTVTLPAGWSYRSSDADVTGSGVLVIAAGTTAGAVPPAAIVYDPGNLSSTTLGGSRPIVVDGGSMIPYVRTGSQVVVLDPAVAAPLGSQVHYETAAGASRGKLLVTPTVTSLPLAGWSWVARNLSTSVSGTVLALVEAL